MTSSTMDSQWQRNDFTPAQIATLTTLNEAGRACSARELAGDHRIAPVTPDVAMADHQGATSRSRPHGAARPEPLGEPFGVQG